MDIFQNNSMYSQVIGMPGDCLLHWLINSEWTDRLINLMINLLGEIVM